MAAPLDTRRIGHRRSQCRQCFKTFSREDHLKRHELNHQSPQYVCAYLGCDLRFHRRDVLNRHHTAHVKEAHAQIPKKAQTKLSTAIEDQIHLDQNTLTDRHADPWTFDGSYDTCISDFASNELGIDIDLNIFPLFPPLDSASLDRTRPQDNEISSATLSECVNLFFQHDLPRLPCISNCKSSQSTRLQYSMAALGASHSDRLKATASEFHHKSIQMVHAAESELCQLQSQVLAVDFAIWSRKESRRQWAISEMSVVATSIRNQVRCERETDATSNWNSWLRAESFKRTVFAFYITASLAYAFLGVPMPITSQEIPLSLPCDVSLWEADSEVSWNRARERLSASNYTEVSFPETIYALLVRDNTRDYYHESAGTFNQYILLSAILEEICLAKSLASNYTSFQGWYARRMEAFRPRQDLNETLEICKSLWWASAECLWQNDACAHLQEENIMLLQYMFIALNDRKTVGDVCEYNHYRFAAQSATEIFTSCSKVGFLEVSKTCRATVSRPGRHCAVASARFLRRWAQRIDSLDPQSIHEHDRSILIQVRQACRRGLRQCVSSEAHNTIEKLEPVVTQMWCTMLGTDWVV
ncbi:hypothetical protein B0O99DRAFT_641104 [Bisporella sp. PMI_857]|nr:hypothetical protein B0O99DRAFT_641104 [Bisporella sp. PMI_857]